ncbi:MAG: hypothetical protein V1770_04005, partial [bacterium]
MMSIILEFLIGYFPPLAGYFLIILITAIIAWKIALFYKDTKNVCDSHEELKNKLDLLIEKFNALIITLNEKAAIKDANNFITKSPIHLTEQSKKLMEEIGWVDILKDEYKRSELFKILNGLDLKTPADAQNSCVILLNDLYAARDINIFTPVKNYLY